MSDLTLQLGVEVMRRDLQRTESVLQAHLEHLQRMAVVRMRMAPGPLPARQAQSLLSAPRLPSGPVQRLQQAQQQLQQAQSASDPAALADARLLLQQRQAAYTKQTPSLTGSGPKLPSAARTRRR